MASLACPPERSVVGVILTVAGVAGHRRGNPRDVGFPVASLALQRMVRARQRVAGLLVVIKAPACPTVGVVAVHAGGAETADMVGISVTVRACARRIFERRGPMAFLAGYHCMQPDERESGQIVVESNPLSPARLLVALLAGVAELALVRIIFAMA